MGPKVACSRKRTASSKLGAAAARDPQARTRTIPSHAATSRLEGLRLRMRKSYPFPGD
jgi:hypothetical protein